MTPTTTETSASAQGWALRFTDFARRTGLAGRIWIAGLTVAVAGWGLSSLWLPFGWDQGCFGYIGRVISQGGMPYRDAWDVKGPLTFYVFAALESLFGRQMWGVRVLDLVLAAAAARAVFGIVSRFGSRFAALGTALGVVLAFGSFGNWYTGGQPDAWAALLLVVVADLLTRRPEQAGAREVVIASFIIGSCALLKPLYSGYLVLVVCSLWPATVSERRVGFGRLALAAGAYLLPIVLLVGWIAAKGALPDLFDAYFRFHVERIQTEPEFQMSILRVAQATLGVFTIVPLLAIVTPAAALGAGYLVRDHRRAAAVLIAWALLSLALIGSQRKFLVQNYSWHPLYPPLLLLAGIGFARLWAASRADGAPARWLIVAAVLLCSKLVTRDPLAQTGRWLKLVTGRTTQAQYWSTFETKVPALEGRDATSFGFSVPRDFELARYIEEHTRPDERITIWSDPLTNYLSDRRSITPVTLSAAFTTWGSADRRRRYRVALLAGMHDPHVAYFGIPAKDLLPGDDEYNIPTYMPELATLLATDYDEVERFGDVRLFRHRAASPVGAVP